MSNILQKFTRTCLGLALFSTLQTAVAEVLIPVSDAEPVISQQSNRLGGSIAMIDENGVEINAIYYPFHQKSIKIHGLNGKLIQPASLKIGMLVSIATIQESQSIKISEIWVIKNE